MAGPEGAKAAARSDRLVASIEPVDVPLERGLRAFTGPRAAWLAPDEPSVVGVGETATIEAEGKTRFEQVRRAAGALFEGLTVDSPPDAPAAARPRLLGGFAFHDAPSTDPSWTGFPGAWFALPRIQLARVDGRTWLAVTANVGETSSEPLAATVASAREQLEGDTSSPAPPPGVTDLRRSPERDGWREQVEAAVARIEAGELEKVVLAQTLTATLRGPCRLTDVIERLGDTYPECYRFAFDPGLGATFFGATPERLVRQRGDQVETDAIAGSIGRGGTPSEDRRLADALEDSAKARHEHAVVVDAVRGQLTGVADEVSVGDRTVRKLPNVQHLAALVSARLREPAHVLDLVAGLHPTPAVGGRPPDAAGRIIDATERFDRGWYAAPVGWFDANGDGTFAVGIRSAVATSDEVTLFAGNGLVADSDPDVEWDELQLKYRPILDQLR